MGVFDFGILPVEDDAEGIQGIVGGEDVTGAEDGQSFSMSGSPVHEHNGANRLVPPVERIVRH